MTIYILIVVSNMDISKITIYLKNNTNLIGKQRRKSVNKPEETE